MADKGKRLIEQDDIFSLIDFDVPEEEKIPDESSPVEQLNNNHGMKVKLMRKTAIPYRVPVDSQAYQNWKAILKDMENTEDGFFAKFLHMKGVDPQNPQSVSSKLADALNITDSLGAPLIPGTRIIPPGTHRAAQLEKLLKIYLEDTSVHGEKYRCPQSGERYAESNTENIQQLIQVLDALNKEISNEIGYLTLMI
ncbi:hypothetical protein CRG98_024283 [Punica granatum]|uniref:Uncharacterized protein n=1 Tax=Punica granatum TaxID=22663 RepID=A0A2I0JG72_PUNGR|nr:hypothetical protein CRG98_024283 [Punica granatum]